MREYESFEDGGKTYCITDPKTPETWKNFLFNENYYTEVNQHLQGESSIVTEYLPKKISTGERILLIKNESNELYKPCVADGKMICRPYENRLVCAHDGIETEALLFVPTQGTYEICRIRVSNQDNRKRNIKLYYGVGIADESPMGLTADSLKKRLLYKYSFPYHVHYHEKKEAENKYAYFCLMSNTVPQSYELSAHRFEQTVCDKYLSGTKAEAEACVEIMQFDLELEPNGEKIIYFLFGGFISLNEALKCSERFDAAFAEKSHKNMVDKWEEMFARFVIKTPYKEFDGLINFWIKKQTVFLAVLNRMSTCCPIRNQLQDIMGYGYIEPEKAAEMIFHLVKRQRQDGFIQQWYMTDGAPPVRMCLLHHSDAPIWFIIAVLRVVFSLGDMSFLERKSEYIDGGEDSVYIHLVNAAYYMYAQMGRHGLCLIHDGDWTDPVNGAGYRGRGESTWNTFALVYATKELIKAALYFGDIKNVRLLTERMRLAIKAVNDHAWFETQYCAGFDDDGNPFGTPEGDGRILLNAQTWAIISGCADKEKTKILSQTMKGMQTSFGPVLLAPPFEEWNPVWGRVSLKKSGTTENGSVYCHAVMFKAYADAILGDADELYRTLWQVLPINPDNPPSKNFQMPIYVPNYYYALQGSPNFGRSSCNFHTGTAAWMQYLVQEWLMGIQGDGEGVHMKPLLPSDIDEMRCFFKYKRASYDVHVQRGEKFAVFINKKKYDKTLLPYAPGEKYSVEIFCTDRA